MKKFLCVQNEMKSLCFSNVFWNETINNLFLNSSNLCFCNILLTTKVSLKKELVKIWLIYFPFTHSFLIQTVFHKAVGFLCDLVWHRYFSTSCLLLAWHLNTKTKGCVCEHRLQWLHNHIMKMCTCIKQGYNIASVANRITITLQRVIIWRRKYF